MFLSPATPLYDFSFIITTRNNEDELNRTINSIVRESLPNSEMVVVDGSDFPLTKGRVQKLLDGSLTLTYVLDNKKGVFNAMNLGVQNSYGCWIIMITAGDILKSGAKSLLEIVKFSERDVVVFAQDYIDQSGNLSYSFYPTHLSIWPHQSVVLRRTIHEKVGLYPEQYRFASDQYLFADVRKNADIEIRQEVFSTFYLGGITSGASIPMSYELYGLRRKLGNGLLFSFIQSFIFIYIRFLLEKNQSTRALSALLRRFLFSYYKKPKQLGNINSKFQ